MRYALGAILALVAILETGAMAADTRPPAAQVAQVRDVRLIYNHGTSRPQVQHQCNETRDVPSVVRDIASRNSWTVHYLCSAATDGGVRGSYTYKRADEILAMVAQLRGAGVPARHIFVLGHSAGGWSSLMAARKDHSQFNGIIAFAPAFAGRRSEEVQYPWWRRELQPQQIAYLRAAPRIDALIFAHEDDAFDRPQDIAPLAQIPGIRIVAFNECQGGHRTVFTSCFGSRVGQQIEAYIKARIARR